MRALFNRLKDRVFRERLTRELVEEMRSHRAMLERDVGAWAAASRFGNTTHYREEARDMWSLGTVDDLVQDTRYALRAWRATPGFSLVVTLTLALGIGATTAIYTVVDSILLRPLPYHDPGSLVQLIDIQDGGREAPASFQEYVEWKRRTTSVLSEVAVGFGHGEVLQRGDRAEQLQGAAVSANMPAMLGARVLLGRTFRPDEDSPSSPPVVMLSEPLWRSRFGGDPAILGRAITLTDKPYTVIGVFAAGPNTIRPSPRQWSRRRLPDFWEPLRLDDKSSPPGTHWLEAVGRLRPGVSLAAARARLTGIATAIQRDRATTHGIAIEPLAESLFGTYRAPLRLLLAAVVLLLVIACVNTANLLLARTAMRRREFAVRTALGAGRQRLLRLLLVESVVRAAVGGALGVGLAYGLVRGMRAWLGQSVARMADATVDARVWLVAAIMTVGAGLAFGLLPALRAGRVDAVDDLRDGARGATGGTAHDRVRRMLMVSEIALSFMLLATAGVLARSVVNLLRVPKGFDTSDLVAGYTWLSPTRYPDSLTQKIFFDRLLSELGAIYGRANVTLASDIPVAGGVDGTVDVEGRTYPLGSMPNAEKRIVGGNYFEMLRARVVAGRSFMTGDVLGAPPVVIINQTLAAELFPKESALGKRVAFSWGIDGYQTIVGIVADLREGALDRPSRPAIYIPAEQRPSSTMRFLVRTAEPEGSVVKTFRDVLRRVDPTIPLVETQTMSAVVQAAMAQQRIMTTMLAAFALAALVLAAVGLYGVISYMVAQRTQELGVRAALGALPRDLMRLVLRQAVASTVVGIAFGVAGALATRRLIAAQLFGVRAADPAMLGAAALVLAVVAALASIVPMRRAASADPLEALRAQ